jgi:MarR family 2-MHQ and catechol resistance regulon transcriptional repressor
LPRVTKPKNEYDRIAELICELTRNCNIKEDIFAASFNLSPTEVRLLKLFVFADSYSIKEIKEKLNLTAGRITHILLSLERKKIILRIPSPSDKRTIQVKLQAKASPLIRNIHQNYDKLHKDLLKNVDRTKIKNMVDSLQILVTIFKNWVGKK